MESLAGNHLRDTQMEGNIKIEELKKKRICPCTEVLRHKYLGVG